MVAAINSMNATAARQEWMAKVYVVYAVSSCNAFRKEPQVRVLQAHDSISNMHKAFE